MSVKILIGDATLYLGDCLEVLPMLGKVDMVLADPPYGTTACKWDSVIPLDTMWVFLQNIIHDSTPVVMMAQQPFTTKLIDSNINRFKYCWVWNKNLPTGFANAKRRPMTAHEDVCVFYQKQCIYNKQKTQSKIKDRALGGSNGLRAKAKEGNVYGIKTLNEEIILKKFVSPRTVLDFDCVPRAKGTLHPTQKPVALMEYLIRTYTNEGDTVLDFTMGSGTTGVACIYTRRKFIGIELDEKYFNIACKRIEDVYAQSDLFIEPSVKPVHDGLFTDVV